MNTKITMEWFSAAIARAIKTLSQTALGMITVGSALNEVDWRYVISVSVVAAIYSLLTSFATNLPEVGSDGVINIDKSNPEKDTYSLVLNDTVESIDKKKRIVLTVESK